MPHVVRQMMAALMTAVFCVLAQAWPAGAAGEARAVFDLGFDPPILSVSRFGPDGLMLAVQAGQDGHSPAKVLAIDGKGRVTTVEELGATREVKVPAGRLWMTGDPRFANATGATGGRDAPMPVTAVRVFLAGGGGSYAAAYMTRGAYYELRHKDSSGRLLFVAAPRDGYGLKDVKVSRDSSRVVVVDESAREEPGAGGPGQRLYFYDRTGRLIADHDFGNDLDSWLDASGGFLGDDGSYYAAVRGRGAAAGGSIVLFDSGGNVAWEKKFYGSHGLAEDFGGLFRITGGTGSLLSFVDVSGALMAIERYGYGYDFWLSRGGERAYILVFKEFDVAKSGVAGWVRDAFPGAEVVTVPLSGLLPPGAKDPAITFSPDGEFFIHRSFDEIAGHAGSTVSLYDASARKIWEGYFGTGAARVLFTREAGGVEGSGGGRAGGFLLILGRPADRLVYFRITAP